MEEFDDLVDAGVWTQLRIPGSHYAIVLNDDGTVRAKGTFKDIAQLDGALATAGRRRAGLAARYN